MSVFAPSPALIEEGRKAIISREVNCIDCHFFHEEGSGKGPDLTGWVSRDWNIDFIKNPAHKRFYGRLRRTPAIERQTDRNGYRLAARCELIHARRED